MRQRVPAQVAVYGTMAERWWPRGSSRNKITDHVLNTASTIFYATPDFFIGIVGILLFAITIPGFPPEGPQSEALTAPLTDFHALTSSPARAAAGAARLRRVRRSG